MSFTEGSYENALITLYENMGYQHLYGPDIERDYYVPFYEEQLLDSLSSINPNKPQAAIHEAIAKLKDIDTGSLTQKNELFMDYLQHGIEVSYFDGKEQRNEIVYLIDYEHIHRNDFQIINQWTFVEHSKNGQIWSFSSMDCHLLSLNSNHLHVKKQMHQKRIFNCGTT